MVKIFYSSCLNCSLEEFLSSILKEMESYIRFFKIYEKIIYVYIYRTNICKCVMVLFKGLMASLHSSIILLNYDIMISQREVQGILIIVK